MARRLIFFLTRKNKNRLKSIFIKPPLAQHIASMYGRYRPVSKSQTAISFQKVHASHREIGNNHPITAFDKSASRCQRTKNELHPNRSWSDFSPLNHDCFVDSAIDRYPLPGPGQTHDRSMDMRGSLAVAVVILMVFSITSVQAEKVYMWTSPEGTRHFSNEPPPEGTKNVEIVESIQPPDAGAAGHTVDHNRQAYDKIVEKAKSEARQMETDRKAKKAAVDAEKKRRIEQERDARINAERAKLQKEIDAINARGLSPTFSQGMKDNLIKKVQNRIDILEKDPEMYFKNK